MSAYSVAGDGPGSGCRLGHDCCDPVRITRRYLLFAAKHGDARGLGSFASAGQHLYDVTQCTPQDFLIGFPGITRRFEWFAVDYSGKFWIETPGLYRFRLVSDD